MTELALTPSQTSGPYRDRLLGGPISNRRRRVRSRARSASRACSSTARRPRTGRPGRDLAGERGRPLRAPGRRSRGDPARERLHRLRALGHRGRRPLRVRHREARPRAVDGRPTRRRTCSSVSSLAASSSASRPACTSPTRRRRTRRTRCLFGLEPEERATLVARAEDGGLRFDIVLQGTGETTFFAV